MMRMQSFEVTFDKLNVPEILLTEFMHSNGFMEQWNSISNEL